MESIDSLHFLKTLAQEVRKKIPEIWTTPPPQMTNDRPLRSQQCIVASQWLSNTNLDEDHKDMLRCTCATK